MARRRTRYKEPAAKKEMVEVECAFCRGTGRDPFGIMSHLSNCSVCGGKGVVKVAKPNVTCRACDGTGIQPFTRLTCLACGGKGVVSVADKTEACPVCGGADADTENRYCLRCHGSGVVSVKELVVTKGS